MIYLALVIAFLLGVLVGLHAAKRRYPEGEQDLFDFWRETWSEIP